MTLIKHLNVVHPWVFLASCSFNENASYIVSSFHVSKPNPVFVSEESARNSKILSSKYRNPSICENGSWKIQIITDNMIFSLVLFTWMETWHSKCCWKRLTICATRAKEVFVVFLEMSICHFLVRSYFLVFISTTDNNNKNATQTNI